MSVRTADGMQERPCSEDDGAYYGAIFQGAALGIMCVSLTGHCLKANQQVCDFLGYSFVELQSLLVQELCSEAEAQTELAFAEKLFRGEIETYQRERQFLHKNGSWVRATVFVSLVQQTDRTPDYFIWMVQPHHATLNASNQSTAPEATSSLELRKTSTVQEKLIGVITHHIRQSLNLTQVLQTTVNEVRQFLHADRVFIYQLSHVSNISGSVVVESCSPSYISLKGWRIGDSSVEPHHLQPYYQGQYQALSSISQSLLSPAYIQLLESFQVRSHLVIPILQDRDSYSVGSDVAPALASSVQLERRIWGFLVAHQCGQERVWQPSEIELLQGIEDHLAVAIQQAELYERLQQLNTDLEYQVGQKTSQLQKALASEAVLRRITEKIRDTLDESAILQTAVQELTQTLSLTGCYASLSNQDLEREIGNYHFSEARLPIADLCVQLQNSPDIRETLAQGSSTQFCPLTDRLARKRVAVLISPIADDQDQLGNLWLFHDKKQGFSVQDIQLVQQVANQCAIAIRQSRLHQTAQKQIQELQKLNSLKDDFLNTTSHELRTPLSSIKTATQLLELILKQSNLIVPELPEATAAESRESKISTTITRCLKTLTQECDREINLINDLLMLQQLDAGTHALVLSPIHLQDWVPQVAETFTEKFASHQQTCTISIASDLPPLISDLFLFDRFLDELLTNAYKFTPATEQITVTANQVSLGRFQVCVSNTGVQIPASEFTAIFDRFYRIPSADPWKHSGTGLGLALVQKVVRYLGGTVLVKSDSCQTSFIVELPSISTATIV